MSTPEVTLARAFASVPDWSLAPASRTWLRPDYLRALEEAAPPRLRFRYAVIARDCRALAAAALQLVASPRASACPGSRGHRTPAARGTCSPAARPRPSSRGRASARSSAGTSSPAATRASRRRSQARRRSARSRASWTSCAATSRARRVRTCWSSKDVADLASARAALRPLGFVEVAADPIMALALRPSWRRLDDYLADLTARYRSHARQAMRASAAVERRHLDPDGIRAHAPRVDALHAAVLARATACPSSLDARAFATLAEALGSRFAFVGYFHEGELVAFNTRYVGDRELESHYGLESVSFGRGSLEMKSGLGASPVAMSWFGRSVSALPVRPLAALTPLVTPAWVRHDPFRCRLGS